MRALSKGGGALEAILLRPGRRRAPRSHLHRAAREAIPSVASSILPHGLAGLPSPSCGRETTRALRVLALGRGEETAGSEREAGGEGVCGAAVRLAGERGRVVSAEDILGVLIGVDWGADGAFRLRWRTARFQSVLGFRRGQTSGRCSTRCLVLAACLGRSKFC